MVLSNNAATLFGLLVAQTHAFVGVSQTCILKKKMIIKSIEVHTTHNVNVLMPRSSLLYIYHKNNETKHTYIYICIH